MAVSPLSLKPAAVMYFPNTRFSSRLTPSQEESLTDLTYYEAEHIPLKVVMKPLSTNPRIRLNLKLIVQKQAYTQAKPEALARTGHTAVLGRDRVLRLHARATSDLVLTAGKSQTPMHTSWKTLAKASLPSVTLHSTKHLLYRNKKPLVAHLLATKSPTHITFKSGARVK